MASGLDRAARELDVELADVPWASGWAFQPGVHQQVWWVDQGDEPPLVIIVDTPSADRDFADQAAALLDTLVIGEPAPHPVPDTDAGIDL